MASFEQYADKYETIRMERRHGVLQMTFHTDGGSFKWGEVPHRELGYAFTDVGSDPDTKVIIMTGTGENFLAGRVTEPGSWRTPPPGSKKTYSHTVLWDKTYWEGKRLLINLLDIEVPVISAVNGPATTHPEIPVMCDIVLAAEEATFRDTHFTRGTVPGDGAHVVWLHLLGQNRGKYFLVTGQTLSAREALELGLVNEVLPREKLLQRAWELAEQLAQKPPLTLRYSRVLLNLQLKRLMLENQGYGLALEGLGAVNTVMKTQ